MSMAEWIGIALIGIGLPFFLAAGVGLLRFPDIYSRLHALTKADNVGLGLVLAGVALIEANLFATLKLGLIWLLFLLGSATAAHALARMAWRAGLRPWRKE